MEAHLRLATAEDAAGIRAIYAPIVRETPISFELNPPSSEEIAARVQKTLTQYPWLVCAYGGQVLAYAYAGAHSERAAYRWSVNVSVYVRADARRLGVGRTLYETLFAMLRIQGIFRAYAGITLPNPASVGLHESLGFRPVGAFERVGYKLGRWHDVGYWQLSLQSAKGAPAAPMPLPAMLNGAAAQSVLSAGSERLARDGEGFSETFGCGNQTEVGKADGEPPYAK